MREHRDQRSKSMACARSWACSLGVSGAGCLFLQDIERRAVAGHVQQPGRRPRLVTVGALRTRVTNPVEHFLPVVEHKRHLRWLMPRSGAGIACTERKSFSPSAGIFRDPYDRFWRKRRRYLRVYPQVT